MGNKHVNGSEPIVMSAEEYDREAELWKANNGEIRDDHPHGGADYPHSHWYDKGEPNVDFVCVREEEKEDDDDDVNDSDDDDNDDVSDNDEDNDDAGDSDDDNDDDD